MTTRSNADPAPPYPNNSTALFRGNKQLRHGNEETDTQSQVGLHDMRGYPHEENRKNKDRKSGNYLRQLASGLSNPMGRKHSDRGEKNNSNLSDTYENDNGFRIWTDIDGEHTCALIRSVSRLTGNDVTIWRNLAEIAEIIIEDDDGNLKSLPAELANLKSLRVLKIHWSPLKFIGPEVSHLELTQLYLERNELRNIDPVFDIKSLTLLNVSSNFLEVIPEMIGSLNYLRELDVSGNKLRSLPEAIGSLALLNVLIVASNVMRTLPESIGQLKDLRTIDISGNRFSKLSPVIGKMDSLLTLIASNNILSTLPDTLQDCPKLENIFLRRNQFEEVPEVLSAVHRLTLLNMNQNSIERMNSSIISLKSLMLDDNEFDKIPDAVLDCHELEFLSMTDNIISVIPEDITRLQKLQRLYLTSNAIEDLPKEICELSQLKHILVEDNVIRTIPFQIHILKRLEILKVDKENLEGKWGSVYLQGIVAIKNFAARLERGSVLVVQKKKEPEQENPSGISGINTSQMNTIEINSNG